jgi:hypothetical protein
METFDKRTVDSTGAFLVGMLEKFDPKINEPLVSVTYTRDISLRTDVSLSDESASFTQDSFAAKDGSTGGYVGTNTTTVGEVGLDVKKVIQPLNLWSKKASWTIVELMRSMQLGRPIDSAKLNVLLLDFQMEADRTAYIGSTKFGTTGLFNSPGISASNALTGNWATAAADLMIADMTDLLQRAYEASAFTVAPTDLRLDPTSFGILQSTKVSSAGNMSVADYFKVNCISNTINGRPLTILPQKYLAAGQAVSNKNRMVAYTNDPQYVQFPLVPMQRQQMVYADIAQSVAYLGNIGQTELRYPETLSYADGL